LATANTHLAVPLNITGNTTPEQNALFKQFLGDAAQGAWQFAMEKLDQHTANVVLEGRERLRTEIRESFMEIIKRHAISDHYKAEEVRSTSVYPERYRFRPVEAQVTMLRKYFPQLGDCMERMGRRQLPEGAEGWFAIPRWQAIADSYSEAVGQVLAVVEQQRKFANQVAGKVGTAFLRETDRAARAKEILGEQQAGNDILVVAAQLGILHRGKSARRTRVVMKANEYGLGTFAVGCILLTHPERLSHCDSLMIDCCGDEYSLTGSGVYDRVPLFDYDLSGLQFSVFYHDRARPQWGSPTAFLFQHT
jgi:hypothetical protein